MAITNAPPVSKRPSEPNDSHLSHNRIFSAMLMIRNYRKLVVSVPSIMTTFNAPPVSKRPSEPNDSKSSQIRRF